MKRNVLVYGIVLFVMSLTFTSCGGEQLSGVFVDQGSELLQPSGESYAFYQDGKMTFKKADGSSVDGTYSIKGDELTVKYSGRTVTYSLSADRKTFDWKGFNYFVYSGSGG